MSYLETVRVRDIDKFQNERFDLLKSKMEMALASIDPWDIVDEAEGSLPSHVDLKV